jgi:hypothetical protein
VINVFFPYYECGDPERQAEIDMCLRQNANNSFIDRLFVLIDDDSVCPIESPNLDVIYVDKRVTYRFWIELTKKYCSKGISILCNSDIYFDDSLEKLNSVLSAPKSFLALSRWELLGGDTSKHPNPHWSQDTWAINAEDELSDSLMHQIDFPMGVPRCDNKIAYLFAVFGWKVFNPVNYVKSIHAHETQMRTYHKKMDERILGGVAYVHPGEGVNTEATLDFDVWIKRADTKINGVKINKTLERWQKEAAEEQGKPKYADVDALKLVEPCELLEAIKQGNVEQVSSYPYRLITYKDNLYFNNLYTITHRHSISEKLYNENKQFYTLAGFIPPVLDTYVNEINLKPVGKSDINFWQYPCATEKKAFENHLAMKAGDNIDVESKSVNIYVPLPWATYVDKKSFPDGYLTKIKNLLSSYREFVASYDYTLKVHSVCQHIHWVRMLEKAEWLGITDFYLSHKDSKSEAIQDEVGTKLTLHGWTLIAVNYETPERNEGMERKPMSERNLLASFIGAHMKHYRDDSRIKLFEAAKAYGQDDVLVDLGDEWHFNKVVYEEQVLNKEIESHHIDEHHKRTFRYNTILSDSKFSLCPEGAGPNTLRFWESIAVGSIPVVFSDDLSAFHDLDFSEELLNNVILVKGGEITRTLFDELANISEDELFTRSNNLLDIYSRVREQRSYQTTKLSITPLATESQPSVQPNKKPLNILYVGASVTAQKNGYRPELNKIFEKHDFSVNQKVLATGATGSMFGLCNLSSSVQESTIYDLAVFEYSTGDLNIGLTPEERIEDVVYQSLMAMKCLAKNVVLINNYRSDYENNQGDFIRNLHRAAADRAEVPVLDIYPAFEKMRANLSDTEWKNIYRDNVHTAVKGSELVAAEIYKLLPPLDFDRELDGSELTAYQTASFVGFPVDADYSEYTYPSSGQKFPFFTLNEDQVLRLSLKGELWGLLSVVGPQSGWVEIKSGDLRIQKFNQLDAHCYYNRVQPRQFIRKFDGIVDLTIELVGGPLDFNAVKEAHSDHELPRALKLSYLMGRDLEIVKAEIMDK